MLKQTPYDEVGQLYAATNSTVKFYTSFPRKPKFTRAMDGKKIFHGKLRHVLLLYPFHYLSSPSLRKSCHVDHGPTRAGFFDSSSSCVVALLCAFYIDVHVRACMCVSM